MSELDCDDCRTVESLQYLVTDIVKMLVDKLQHSDNEIYKLKKRIVMMKHDYEIERMMNLKEGGDA